MMKQTEQPIKQTAQPIKQTPLYAAHLEAGGVMVGFGGWQMPLHYGSQLDEHQQVRSDVGMFDISHMCALDVTGKGAGDFMRILLANDVAKLKTQGRALYSCMLNETGGVIDDLIVYYQGENQYRMVVNAATTDNDLEWIERQATAFEVNIEVLSEVAMIAVQGPNARAKVAEAMPGVAQMCAELKPFHSVSVGSLFIARTGYTGEDGFEIMLPKKAAAFTWKMLLEVGVKPCGLGARDTLRLEAGMSLYGAEMSAQISPLEAALGWTIDLTDDKRAFIGRAALEKLANDGIKTELVGLVLNGKGVIRNQQVVKTNLGEGAITSGSFSPTMGVAIALARVPKNSAGACEIQIRARWVAATIVKPPFVRNGKVLV